MITLAIALVFPFAWTLVTSLSPGSNLAEAPDLAKTTWSFASYGKLFTELKMPQYLTNSLIVSLATAALQLITGSMAAYAFARMTFRGRNALFLVYVATMLIPVQVVVVPLFIQLKSFGLNDSYFALIAPSATSALSIFILRQAMLALPSELDEAATIDGAGPLRTFLSVVLPLIRPALGTVAVLVFLGSWNNFLWPLIVIHSDELKTLPLGLSTLQGVYSSDWSVIMAGSIVSILPVLILYVLAQRYFVAGIANTGLK
ncbi:carbohydrate ABC transporter permease [Leifsonia aquatica]|uniref:carbohydrate ABC transporter permease n=1 Tax=Leifsonia aquatica TaxID=144185 RepID=UPI0004688356|nr:carbohydrate ABC transporter permease [Leifsonia aquatica]